MKTSKNILDQIKTRSSLNLLNQHKCYERFINMLPPRFRNAIAFVYIKEKIMYIALSHPGYKMELSYNKDLLLDLLKVLVQNDSECCDLAVESIIFFSSKYFTDQKPDIDHQTVPYYNELSTGAFEDMSENPQLKAQFERLRKAIISNREDV